MGVESVVGADVMVGPAGRFALGDGVEVLPLHPVISNGAHNAEAMIARAVLVVRTVHPASNRG